MLLKVSLTISSMGMCLTFLPSADGTQSGNITAKVLLKRSPSEWVSLLQLLRLWFIEIEVRKHSDLYSWHFQSKKETESENYLCQIFSPCNKHCQDLT